jgi:long-chain acyl-CoA synthetase
MTNMDASFRERAALQGTALAILTKRQTLTYAELDARIAAVAEQLAALGLAAGGVVGLHLPSGLDYIVHCYAAWRRGCTVVPIALELSDSEKQEVVSTIALDAMISAVGVAAPGDSLRIGEPVVLGPRTFAFLLDSQLSHPPELGAVNAAFIRFTSGTTGRSKGVVLSHETVMERIVAANDVLRIGPEDRVMWLLSMSYHFTVSITAYLSFGAAIILPSNNLAAGILDVDARFHATFLYGSPMHCALLADYPGTGGFESLRAAISTTTSMTPAIGDRFLARFGIPVSQALGIIEIGLPCINLRHAKSNPGSVGTLLPAYEWRLEDAGYGDDLREVAFRGPGFLDAYYSPWTPRASIAPDGWFETHDVGVVDADGCLSIKARSKDVISVMGMKFFPQEVERVLSTHPSVREVAVFAVPHERMGQVPRARIVLHAGQGTPALEAELRQLCQREVAAHKVPEEFEFLSELPRTASGKVLHRV